MPSAIKLFGHMPNQQDVHSITLSNGNLEATFLTYGAVLQDLRLAGHDKSLVLGLNTLEDYLNHSRYFGATAGRYANRIAQGSCVLDGIEYQLDKNFLQKHLLHGGSAGTGKQVWTIEGYTNSSVKMLLVSPDGHMGFPGTLSITATFSLLDNHLLDIQYAATTDKTTLCNLAHHSYFNLGNSDTVLDHTLHINAEHYLPVTEEKIPTGIQAPVAGTGFDYRHPQLLSTRLEHTPLDHNFCLADNRTSLVQLGQLGQAAQLSCPISGLSMEILTTEPGLQIYDGAGLNVPVKGLDKCVYGAYAGLAIEPQIWPDSPNHPHFPQAVLKPNENYRQHTQFQFTKSSAL